MAALNVNQYSDDEINKILKLMTRKPVAPISPIKDIKVKKIKESKPVEEKLSDTPTDKTKIKIINRIFGNQARTNSAIRKENKAAENTIAARRGLKRKLEQTDEMKLENVYFTEGRKIKLKADEQKDILKHVLLNFESAMNFSIGAEIIESYPNANLLLSLKTYTDTLHLFENLTPKVAYSKKLKILNYRCQSVILFRMYRVSIKMLHGSEKEILPHYMDEDEDKVMEGVNLEKCRMEKKTFEKMKQETECTALLIKSTDLWERSEAESDENVIKYFNYVTQKAGPLRNMSSIKEMCGYVNAAIKMIRNYHTN